MAHEKTCSPAGPEAASAPKTGGMFGGADVSRKKLFRRKPGFLRRLGGSYSDQRVLDPGYGRHGFEYSGTVDHLLRDRSGDSPVLERPQGTRV